MRWFSSLILLSAVLAPFALLGDAESVIRSFHVSLVEKDSVTEFYNRMATVDGQVVVTEASVPGAIRSEKIDVLEGHRMYLVETFANDAELPGEIARLENIAVVSVPNSVWLLHRYLGDHARYGELVSDQLSRVPGVAPAPDFEDGRVVLERLSPIDPDYLKEKLDEYSGATSTTIGGDTVTIRERGSAEGREYARAWLAQEFSALGFTTSEQNYGNGTNFVAERTGDDTSRTLVISAHIDSVGNAGADDDGGGVILALAVAKSLQETDLAFNLRFLGFDQEERGLVGSAAYVRSLNSSGDLDEIVGVVNVEMPGYDADGDGALHIIDCGENTSDEITTVFENVLAQTDLDLVKEPACTNRSDHASFWRYGKPAIVISQNFFGGDSNPCYHRSCDRTDRMDFDYMRRITEMVALGVADMVASR